MKTLPQLKGMAVTLRNILARTTDPQARHDYKHALNKVKAQIREREALTLRQWVLLVALVYVAGFMAGCATMSGIGEDIQNVSEGYRARNISK